jgi:hypothetical protein
MTVVRMKGFKIFKSRHGACTAPSISPTKIVGSLLQRALP